MLALQPRQLALQVILLPQSEKVVNAPKSYTDKVCDHRIALKNYNGLIFRENLSKNSATNVFYKTSYI